MAHHIGDTGTAFRGRVVDQLGAAIDLSSATLMELVFTPPGASAATKTTTAVFPTPGSKGYPAASPGDGTDGYMEYVTDSAHLDAAGGWKWQGHVNVPGLGERRTDIYTFTVSANL